MFTELQLSDISISLTDSGSEISDNYDKVRPSSPALLDGSAEDCKEILILASYMIRTWQTAKNPAPRMVVPEASQCVADTSNGSLPPPVKFDRGARKIRNAAAAATSLRQDARSLPE